MRANDSALLVKLKEVITLFERGHVAEAERAYKCIVKAKQDMRAFTDKALENLYYETEFLVYGHPDTSLTDVQNMLKQIIFERQHSNDMS